ncbi:MAG: tetratricopeptide repeat protein [Elainella sp. Prado103]|nr:tetratricopeptide repeat protein [Elainella sp. Prado103]
MKSPAIYLDRFKTDRSKWLWLFLLGLPSAAALLWLTQPSWQFQWERWQDRFGNRLEQPYRYEFEPVDTDPTTLLQQEMGFYQDILRQYPDRALEQAALATTYLRMARTTGASNWYLLADQTAQKSLSLLPIDNSEALTVLARVAEARHDFATALQLANQIPQPQEALPIQVTANLAIGELDAADRAAKTLVDLTLSMNAFTLQALVDAAQGEDQQALNNFQYALEVEEAGELSSSARTRTLLGRFHYERGQLERAAQLYREALRILPTYTPALLNLAQLELRQGDWRAADRHYRQAQQAQSGITVFAPLILRGQAQVALRQGQRSTAESLWAKAETQLRQSVDGSASFAFGHRRDLAKLLLERGNPADRSEAISLMAAEVQQRRDANTLSTYATALSQSKRWQEAQSIVQTALDLGTKDAGLCHQAAQIATALGNTDQATQYHNQQRSIDPAFDMTAQQVMDLGVGLGL